MKFKPTAITIILCSFIIGAANAQENIKTTVYLKNSGTLAANRDEADYIREIAKPDSGSVFYSVNEFYKNGNKKLSGKSSEKEYLKLEGVAEFYYPSGILKEKTNYKSGRKFGEGYSYFRNGNLYTHINYAASVPGQIEEYFVVECRDSLGVVLVKDGDGYFKFYGTDNNDFYEEGNVKNTAKDGAWKGYAKKVNKVNITFTEIYANGKQTSGRSVDDKGNVTTYANRMQMPEFVGGLSEFGRYLGKNIRYPNASRRAGISGKVLLTFIVDPVGAIIDVKIISSPADDLGKEAKRVMELSPNWQPATYFGIPVRVQYTQPVNFSLD